MTAPRQWMAALDVEGVLTPEVWIAVAEATGIDSLRRTTREEPDYEALMNKRLAALDEHGITMSQISEVISGLEPLEGARAFLDELRSRTPVVLLSDTFEEFGRPLMDRLGCPLLLCHRLEIAEDRIVGYRLRMADQKVHAVRAFRSLNYRVAAVGDAYNDLTMLAAADAGILFRPPAALAERIGQYPQCTEYGELLRLIAEAMESAADPADPEPR